MYGPQEPLATLVVQAPVGAGEDVVGSELGDVVVGDADGLLVVGDELGGVVVEVGGVVKTELGTVGSASWSGDRRAGPSRATRLRIARPSTAFPGCLSH